MRIGVSGGMSLLGGEVLNEIQQCPRRRDLHQVFKRGQETGVYADATGGPEEFAHPGFVKELAHARFRTVGPGRGTKVAPKSSGK